uniref:Uncharacterized protein n=1 Tax=Arundo donax TaxID=35708 RepID=A0A0A8Y934_ARUDO
MHHYSQYYTYKEIRPWLCIGSKSKEQLKDST